MGPQPPATGPTEGANAAGDPFIVTLSGVGFGPRPLDIFNMPAPLLDSDIPHHVRAAALPADTMIYRASAWAQWN